MIPEIGALIAAYVVTRMAEVLSHSPSVVFVRVCAIVTLLAGLFIGTDLIVTGIKANFPH